MNTPKSLLDVIDLSLSFRHENNWLQVLHNVSFSIREGEAFGLVGESGCGKTTTAKLILLLETPTEGSIHFEGQDANTLNRAGRQNYKSSVQCVFQDPWASLNPRMRAWKAVAEAFQVWRGMSRQQARLEAFGLLQAIGISESQARQFPKSLSGGQRQRVSITRALAPGPKVLIADEPTSSIDQSAQSHLANLLHRLQSERNLAILFISHDLALVRYMTSRVYVMQKGRIVEEGDTERILHRPGHPYTQLLLDSLPGRARQL